ncbi:hypothetical protein ACIGXI_02585 [Kitasatospora aureofaciens]|uniref:hypothetical protein n=1 Tax=Kitasatospora aureofaciens TaxID=1894 RepID=UPI00052692B8|nr:hypothetical protein [Kitasatospora aureofaciens]
MAGGHRWLLDETPWPEQARLGYGALVELVTPEPRVPDLGWLGDGLVGTRGVVVGCEVEGDGPVYGVVTEDGSPWRLGPEFLAALGGCRTDLPPRYRSDLPEGTRVRILAGPAPEGGPAGAVGRVTGLWWESALEPPMGYTVEVGDYTHCVTPEQVELLQ